MTAAASSSATSRVLRANPYWLYTLRAFLPVQDNLTVPRSEAEAIKAISEADRTRDHRRAATLIVELVDRELARGDQRGLAVSMLARAVSFLVEAGEPATALQAIQQRLPHLSESPQRALLAGLVDLFNRRIAEGTQWLHRAVELDPQLGKAWASLAVVFALDRNHARAESAARKAVQYGEHGHINLIDFVLMQSTFEQGLPPEGVFNFKTDDSESALAGLLARLPPVDPAALVQRHNLPIVMIGADQRYFVDFAIPLVLSIARSRTKCGVHLHVMNPGREFVPLMTRLRAAVPGLPIQVSTESVHTEQYLAPVTYFSGVRYCRLYQLMQANEAPVILLDADALVHDDLAKLPGFQDPGIDVGMPHYPDEPIWQEIAAGMSYFKPTPAGRKFLGEVARFIAHNLVLGAARWYVDQLALYVAWRKQQDHARVKLFDGADALDLEHRADSLVWFATGDKIGPSLFKRTQQEILAATTILPRAPREPRPSELVATRHGQMLIWTDDIYIGRSLKARGSWCQHELDLLQQFIRPGYTIVDAGANVGSHTLAFARWLGNTGRVVAFEPQPSVFQLLLANLAFNGIANVQAHPRGLSREAGTRYTVPIAEPHNFGAVTLQSELPADDCDQVEVIPLDSLNLDACHLIKMDIEGMEYEALLGAQHTIEHHRPVLHLENHPDGPHFRDVIDLVRSWGYQIFDHGLKTTNPNLLCLPTGFLFEGAGLKLVE